jgi:Rrf2 family transcriptional regulator, iron-sulfur cluster assembly transcription factor
MKITSQEEYGLRCLLRFARARTGQSLTIPEIATAEGLSISHVAKLLAILRQGGLIESVRGRLGGYRLTTAPADINLGSVLLVLGEPLFDDPGYCQRHAGTEAEGTCVHRDDCTLRGLWRALEHWMRCALDRVTLADLLHNEGHIADLLRSRLTAVIAELPPLLSLNTLGRIDPMVREEEEVGTGGERPDAREKP